jgi:hypothetical protein
LESIEEEGEERRERTKERGNYSAKIVEGKGVRKKRRDERGE